MVLIEVVIMGQKPIINEMKCIGDGICVNVCPAHPTVFEMEYISKVINPNACIEGCTECADNCPTGAIKIIRI
ncbi:MAG: 4Fe-4S binding protein [Thermoplasmata archaeon]